MAALKRFSNVEFLKLPDCAGLLENGKCRWLNVSACIGANCSYYQEENDLERARKRLRSLDEDTQEHIAQKYYAGSRPWVDTGK